MRKREFCKYGPRQKVEKKRTAKPQHENAFLPILFRVAFGLHALELVFDEEIHFISLCLCSFNLFNIDEVSDGNNSVELV